MELIGPGGRIEEAAQGLRALEPVDPDVTTVPALDAWNVRWAIGPRGMTDVVGEVPGCPPLDEVAADPAVVVLLVDLGVDDDPACTDWVALVVTLDAQQQITTIEARYGPA